MDSMRQLGMVGTTFRRAGQAELDRYTLDLARAAELLPGLHRACGFLESVYLATCNRVEVIFVAPRDVSVAECRRRLYRFFHAEACRGMSPGDELRQAARLFHAYEGEGAAEHLFTVAASLDSMTPGEAQILGQVKAAYKRSVEQKLAGPGLQIVFEEAFSAAKKVRTDTRVGTGTVSMVSLALGLIEARLASCEHSGRVVVVGVGDMAHQCGALFTPRAGTSLVFVNRTVGKAQALATQYRGQALSLDAFRERPEPFDVMVTATAAPTPLFDASFFAACGGRPPLVVDLALRRDVEPEGARRAGVDLYDIDRLKDVAASGRKERDAELAAARVVVDDALEAFRRRLVDREVAPVMRTLRAEYQATLDAGLRELFERVLSDAEDTEREKVRRWAQTLVNRMAHAPTIGLKRIAFEHGSATLEAFVAGIRAERDGGGA